MNRKFILIVSVAVMIALSGLIAGESPALRLSWQRDILTIAGEQLPGKKMKILYIEAYCRPNSQTTDWVANTVVGHKTELTAINPDRTQLNLKCTLKDGVIVDHVITARSDEVDRREMTSFVVKDQEPFTSTTHQRRVRIARVKGETWYVKRDANTRPLGALHVSSITTQWLKIVSLGQRGTSPGEVIQTTDAHFDPVI